MRSEHLLLLAIGSVRAHLIPPKFNIRIPTWPEDTTTKPPAPITSASNSPAQVLNQCEACRVIGQALSICANLTPSFTALQPTAQAKCLCYSSTVWSPNIFDNAVQSCANYASTAAPPAARTSRGTTRSSSPAENPSDSSTARIISSTRPSSA